MLRLYFRRHKVKNMSSKLKAPIRFYSSLIKQIKTNKIAFIVFVILRLAVILVIIRCAFEKRYESIFVGFLALLLLLLPPFIEKNFKIELPTVLESIAYTFVFCAEILGEIESFYTRFPFWDTMLHTVSGFIFAAFGFCLVDILNRHKRFKFELSPLFIALLAFCFSMTIGVLWEFFEFGMDKLFDLDMQKDAIVNGFSSVKFDPTGKNTPILIDNIEKTIIQKANGEQIIINGYLDIGIADTMKDLFVNFVGALVFSIFGYLYIKHRGKGTIATNFIPVPKYDINEPEKSEEPQSQLSGSEEKTNSASPEITETGVPCENTENSGNTKESENTDSTEKNKTPENTENGKNTEDK